MAMDPKNLLVLSKFGTKEGEAGSYADAVEAGEYEVDFVVRIHGRFTKGEDRQQRVATRIPWQQMFAVAMSKLNGVTVHSILAEALRGNGRVQAMSEEAGEKAKAAVAELMESTMGTVRGSVKLAVEVEPVEARPAGKPFSDDAEEIFGQLLGQRRDPELRSD